MRSSLEIRGEYGRLSIAYPFKINYENEFSELFRAVYTLYTISVSNAKAIYTNKLTPNGIEILNNYLSINKIKTELLTYDWEPYTNADFKINGDNNLILFTSGKDSTYLLTKLIKQNKKTYAIYFPNINKSESIYEKKSVVEICKDLNVPLIIPKVTNSIRVNRDGHNIGLREQLLLSLAMPVAEKYGCSNIYLGVYATEKPPELYAAWPETLSLTEKLLTDFNYNVSINYMNEETEYTVLKSLAQNNSNLLRKCTSCYSQINFRENKHKRLKEKLPNLDIYKGCGSCIKCLRINSALLPSFYKTSYKSEAQYLERYIRKRQQERYSKDLTLRTLLDDL